MPIHKTTQKAQARTLYFTTSCTQKDIAQLLGVSENTITRWAHQGKWAETKKETYHSPEQEVEQLYNELRQINKRINERPDGEKFATKEELDAKVKMLKLIKGSLKDTPDTWRNIAPEIDLSATVQTERTYKDMSDKEKLDHYYSQIAMLMAISDPRGRSLGGQTIELEPLP